MESTRRYSVRWTPPRVTPKTTAKQSAPSVTTRGSLTSSAPVGENDVNQCVVDASVVGSAVMAKMLRLSSFLNVPFVCRTELPNTTTPNDLTRAT